MTPLLRSLIRETLLLEEVYGAQATVYHGTEDDPHTLISALLKGEFRAGEGAGAMYGKGLYTVYSLVNSKTGRGYYGDHVIKLKVNLYGYIIFNRNVARLVYKRFLTPAQQAEEVGYSETVVKALRGVEPPQQGGFTSDSALSVFKSLQYEVKGLVFTGERDGNVAVVYDPTTAVPMAWKRVARDGDPVSEPWTPVDRASLLKPIDRPDVSAREGRPVQQSALRRSALGDFEAGEPDDMKRLERLPKNQRIVKGDLDLSKTSITSLPAGLQVRGNLDLSKTSITSLPEGLQVDGGLDLTSAKSITALPTDLKVNGYLNLYYSSITALPAGLKVRGNLNLSGTPITALPSGLQVDGDLDIHGAKSIASLPTDLQVKGDIFGLDRKYWDNVPQHLKDKLRL